jgi:hypothetical protein
MLLSASLFLKAAVYLIVAVELVDFVVFFVFALDFVAVFVAAVEILGATVVAVVFGVEHRQCRIFLPNKIAAEKHGYFFCEEMSAFFEDLKSFVLSIYQKLAPDQ